jgi:FKBP-type peptidyl-prolyl cis-trans isomerase FkpA
MKVFVLGIALSTSALCTAYTGGDKGKIKFTTDPKTGVKYHFFKQNKTAAKPAEGDYAVVMMMYRNDRDSLVFDSRNTPNRRRDDTLGVITIPIKKTFNGCLEQGVEMMAAGDSAAFSINTDSLFFKTFKAKALPPYAHAGTYLTFNVKLIKFQNQKQLQEEQQQKMVKQKMEMEQLKAQEAQTIAKYLSDNKITVQPTADSMYFLSRQNVGGKKIEVGDSISVKYTGMLLNGKVFDATSLHGDVPLKMEYSTSMPLIKGWILALGTMSEGEKARILLPSSLAYGGRAMGPDIAPYSPMLFDMEVVKVTPKK